MDTRSHDQVFPFTFIATEGLGVSHTTNVMTDFFPVQAINAGQTTLTINAANGNAVVQDKIFSIHDMGVIEAIGMMWNSRDKQFSMAALPVIKENKSYFTSIWDPTFTLTEADGSVITYTLNSENIYAADKIGPLGLSRIKKTDKGYERFFPGSGIREIYNSYGQLINKVHPSNVTISYQYPNATDLIITLPSGRKIYYEVDRNNALKHHLRLDSMPLASYHFSPDKQTLATHIYQPDGSIYQTTYQQKNNNLLISSDDTTTSSLMFNLQGEIEQCILGNLLSWKFILNKMTRCMEVYAQDKKMLVQMITDANQHLQTVTYPNHLQKQYYKFSDSGQLLESGLGEVNDPNKTIIKSTVYDQQNGLPHAMHLFNASDVTQKTFTYYSGQNELLCGMRLSKKITQQEKSQTTRMIYNDKRQLCYLITPAGRVTQFIYANVAPYRLQFRKQVVTKRFNAEDREPTLDEMQIFWEQTLTAEDKQCLQITQFNYDAYGRENDTSYFTAADSQGEGCSTDNKRRVLRSLDGLGREIKLEIETHREQDKLLSSLVTLQTYDALDRITSLVHGAQAEHPLKQITKKSYRAHQSITDHPTGLKEITSKDKTGRLLANERIAIAKNTSRLLSILHLSLFVKQIVREDGLLEYFYHDAFHRLQYHILPDGVLHHYQYDDLGRLTHHNTYHLPEQFDIKQPIEALVKCSVLTLEQIHLYDYQGQHVYDMVVQSVSDEQGKLQRTGYLTEHVYELGKKIHTTVFARSLDAKLLENISYHTIKSAMMMPDDRDRMTRYFYDADGILIGTHQAAYTALIDDKTVVQSYLTEFEVDGAGNCYHEICYLQPSQLSSDLAQARPASPEALHTWHWFDGAGRKIATLDTDHCITLLDYFADGKLKQQTRLYHPQTIDTNTRLFSYEQLKRDEYSDKVTTYIYDELRREKQVIDHQMQLDTQMEYDAHHNETKRVRKDLKEKDSAPRIVQKSYNEFKELEQEATERISALAPHDKSQWIQHHIHLQTGLRLRTLDAKGHPTLYYYNKARLPVVEIAANGAVRLFEYQPGCSKPSKIYAFYQPLSEGVLNALRTDQSNNGWITEAILCALPKTDAKDRVTICQYDAKENLIKEIETNGAIHLFFYNAFNQITREWHLVDQNQWLQIDHEHDLRGATIKTTHDPQNLQVVTQAAFHDALGRKTSETDELGHTLLHFYGGVCIKIITDVTTLAQKSVAIDAFKRISIEKDATGNATHHHYDATTRTHTVISPLGSTMTTYQNAFGEAERIVAGEREHHIEHAVDGQVEKTIHPDQSQTVQQHDVLGLKTLVIDRGHHAERLHYNAVQQIEKKEEGKWREDKIHLARETIYQPNVFDENEKIIRTQGIVKQKELNTSDRTITDTIDPDGLQLTTHQQMNYAKGLLQLTQKGAADNAQYVETCQRDILNREIAREIKMENGQSLLLNANTYDHKNHLTRVQQADGSSSYHLFDVCSLLRLNIDAEGFAVFYDYDLNQREINRTQYHERLTKEQ